MTPRARLERCVRAALVLFIGILLCSSSWARPKVCLVLSGGGARGAAHIGVLRTLEQMRVPIDCIAGTSMGALVGAAYASGMSVSEMEEMVASLSTAKLFIEKPPRDEVAMRRKLDDRSILLGVEVGVRDGDLLLQKGVVTGVQLETFLRRLSKVSGYHKFDELPIPYRAVATDLVTGKPVVFDAGELPNVMRASMSVPGAVAPAEIGGRILVDGGLTDNLPVGVARAMGAEIVIAVNLGTPLLTRERISSLVGVTAQMINILTEQNVQASLASLRDDDILIEPALGDLSAADFDHLAKTVPIGEAAARKVATRLAALAVPVDAYAAWDERRHAVPPRQIDPVAQIRFRPMSRVNPEALSGLLDVRAGAPIDPDALDRDLQRLFGTGDFEHVNYRILEEAGRRVLEIDAAEKSWGPHYLRFGLGLASDFTGDSFFNLAASYRRTWVNELGAEWRSDVQIGHTGRLATEFYQPLHIGSGLFVAPRAELERRTVDLFRGSERLARYDIRTADAGVDLGYALGTVGEVRLGVLMGSTHAALDSGPEALEPPSRVQRGAMTARLIVDRLDSADFPRFGYAGSAQLYGSTPALGAENSYTKWDADFLGAYSFGRHTLSAAARAGGTLHGELPRYDLLQWGGFLQQSGYPTGALLGQRLVFGRVVYSYKLLEQRLFEGLYAGMSLEAGRMDKALVPGSPSGLLKSMAAFLAADSPLGPVDVGFAWAADGSRSGYLFLGRP
jgi:NTE family protein